MNRGLSPTAKAAVLLLGGLVLACGGAWFIGVNYEFARNAHRVPGTVVGMSTQRVRGNTLYHPIVRYRPVGYETDIEFTARPGLWRSLFDIGETVTVLHNDDEPPEAKIDSFWMLWFLPVMMILLGIACFYAGRHTLETKANE